MPNSVPIGSASSCATSPIATGTGCPARNERTMMSIASGNCAPNLPWRRLRARTSRMNGNSIAANSPVPPAWSRLSVSFRTPRSGAASASFSRPPVMPDSRIRRFSHCMPKLNRPSLVSPRSRRNWIRIASRSGWSCEILRRRLTFLRYDAPEKPSRYTASAKSTTEIAVQITIKVGVSISNGITVSQRLRRIEIGARNIDAARDEFGQEARAHAGRREMTLHRAVWRRPGTGIFEDLLHLQDVAFKAGDLGDRGDTALAIGQTLKLHDHLDGGRDLAAHGCNRHRHAGHADHLLETRDRVARRVGVDRRHRAFVTGVHGLKHVEGFLAAALAEDDAVWTHA